MSVRIAGSAKWISSLLLLCLLLACGGGSRQKTLYVTGVGSPEIVQFNVAGGGALSLAKLIGVGAAPIAIAIDPQARYVYVLNSALGAPAGAISQFTLNSSTGVLAPQTQSNTGSTNPGVVPPIPVGATPVAMTVDPSGNFVFVANQGDSTISIFRINRSTGALSQVGTPVPTAPAVGPSALAVNGNRLFVANLADGISVFTFDSKTGALSPVSGSPFVPATNFCSPATDPATGTFIPCSIDVDPAGKLLYVPNKSADAVAILAIDSSGALTPAATPSVAVGGMPVAVRVHPSGKFVFVANWATGDISIFTVGASGGLSPVLGSPFPSGTNPAYLLNDSTGAVLFVSNAGSDDISAFRVNGSTGALSPASGSPFAANVGSPIGMAGIN
jgi:6-phosphogluconolactonase (cycloisomerase 2 family)